MVEKNWTPVDGWSGPGEYRVAWESCPRCGSKDIEWGSAAHDAGKVVRAGRCLVCGLGFRELSDAEMVDEGCYDTHPVTEVRQDDVIEAGE